MSVDENETLTRARPLAVALWLSVIALMVVAIVAVGGITRLTESGLSITQWQPVSGILPPLTEEAWAAEYAEYRQTPEYRFEAGPAGMTLADFKFIYFWEWFHRVMGRLIGVAYALPLAVFWLRGAIPQGYKPRLMALLSLGALQGVFGWLMVRSGLSGEMTDVSHFWLSVHLITAFVTLGGLIWTALDLLKLHGDKTSKPAGLRLLAALAGIILFFQILLGAWVAGLNAGLASDTWPLMQERFVPEADWSRGALWALTHDPFLLHFLHRWFAWIAAGALVLLAWRTRASNPMAANALLTVTLLQVALGIVTVTSGVELWIAVAHQVTGALLVGALVWAGHAIGRR